MRAEIFQEMRAQYEPRTTEGERERQRLEKEIQSLTSELASETLLEAKAGSRAKRTRTTSS